MNTFVYLLTGFIFGMGIIDNDPIVKIICVVALMFTTMFFVYNTWLYLLKEGQ